MNTIEDKIRELRRGQRELKYAQKMAREHPRHTFEAEVDFEDSKDYTGVLITITVKDPDTLVITPEVGEDSFRICPVYLWHEGQPALLLMCQRHDVDAGHTRVKVLSNQEITLNAERYYIKRA